MKIDIFLTQRHGGTKKQGTGLSFVPLRLCVEKNENETTQYLETKHVTFNTSNFVAALSRFSPSDPQRCADLTHRHMLIGFVIEIHTEMHPIRMPRP